MQKRGLDYSKSRKTIKSNFQYYFTVGKTFFPKNQSNPPSAIRLRTEKTTSLAPTTSAPPATAFQTAALEAIASSPITNIKATTPKCF